MVRTGQHRLMAAVVAAVLPAAALSGALAAPAAAVEATAAVVSAAVPLPASNLDFESGLTGWSTTGTVSSGTGGAHNGDGFAALSAGASASVTITGLAQGSYSLTGWFRGAASNNAAAVRVTGTGGPDAVALLDTNLAGGSTWQQTAHRNVLVYNGALTLTVTAGSAALAVDHLELALDSADQSVANWGFEDGLNGWTTSGAASLVTTGTDAGGGAVRLAAGAQVAQTVAVRPGTRYTVTVRARVDRQDTFTTTGHSNWRGRDGELVSRASTGDRVNLGVRGLDGTVLRQAPSGTSGWSLTSVTFTTRPTDHEVVLYANTIKDAAYTASVTLHHSSGTYVEDPWTGNGADSAYVDNADLFELPDDQVRGADVSFLPAVEDNGGKYFANGVQQDALTVLSNHGVSSVTSMIFVQAGNGIYAWDTLKQVFQGWNGPDGQPMPSRMIPGGYFDKVHSADIGVRATALGMSYLPSFHYSDSWISAAKAYTPAAWMNVDYAGTRTNTDLAHMKGIVYDYVYDFMSDLASRHVHLAGVKMGNEQNGGIVWPVGQGATSAGHAALVTATYDAVEAAAPGVARFVHTNNGYDPAAATSFFGGLTTSGATFDGEAYSLYGGRSSGNILKMATSIMKDPARRYRDYVNVETGFSFTRYAPTFDQQTAQMGQSAFYQNTANGQYNWLLDYLQAPLDVPNPYGQTRGVYYWETDWTPTPGAGSSDGGTADVNNRIMFNNGDVNIHEMGSVQPGRSGDMMDSMYAYLMRGVPKAKAVTARTPLGTDNGFADGTYSVDPTAPTGIALTQASLTLSTGQSRRLQPVLQPTDQVLTDSHIAYASADDGVATVTEDGFVRAQGAGSTTVTATDAAGHSATVAVSVNAPTTAAPGDLAVTANGNAVANGATLSAAALTRLDLVATVARATGKAVVATSSDPAVASFLGETWQTPPGRLVLRADATTKAQLDVHRAGTTTVTVATLDGGTSVQFTLVATKVAVLSVTSSKAESTLSSGRTLQLTATVAPANATFYKVAWQSSDPAIATVDSKGLVTAVGVGDVTIRAVSDDDPTKVGVTLVHVLPVQVEGIVLDRSAMTVQVGTTKTLGALVLPQDANDPRVTWSSSDDGIARVDANGAVTGVALGTATVIATTVQGGFTAQATITVQKDAVEVTAITIDHERYAFVSNWFSSVNPPQDPPTVTLHAAVAPADATNDSVTWASDTPEVATVNAFGIVTAVSPGVAVITATSQDGRALDTATVLVPTLSDDFENRDVGDTWGTGRAVNYVGTMSAAVAADPGDHVLTVIGSGTGGRAVQKTFTPVLRNDLVVLDFDWNVGQPTASKGAFFTLNDSSENRYLSIQTNAGAELVYSTGGKSSSTTTNDPLANAVPVGTGFNIGNVWYAVHVEIDMAARQVTFSLTRKDAPAITATRTVPFAAGQTFTGDVASLQLWSTRGSGTMAWTTRLDDVRAYQAAPVAKRVTASAASIKLIPIAGTLGAQYSLTGTVAPASVSPDLLFSSADTGVAVVSPAGVVTPAHLYDNLADVVSGTTTIRVASKATPSVFVDVPVRVTSEINASEFFWVEDQAGTRVFEEGQPSDPVAVAVGAQGQLVPRLTGGDGSTDVAGIRWSSSDPSVLTVDPATGRLTAVDDGRATITLTVTLYAGEPKTATIAYEVGDVVAPVTKVTLDPGTPSGTQGWWTSPVTVTLEATDGGTGVATTRYAIGTGPWQDYTQPFQVSDDGSTTVRYASTDEAGNVEAEASVDVRLDRTAPTVELVGGPRGTVLFGTVPAAPTCDASDATSGLLSCVVSGYSTAVGTHELVATATDQAGNVARATRSYTVAPYTLLGFYQPVDMDVVNTAKAGSTIPLRFEVLRGATELTDTAEITSIAVTTVPGDPTAPTDEIETLAAGGTVLRYDTTTGSYAYNWKSPSTKGTVQVRITTRDGGSLSAVFRLR